MRTPAEQIAYNLTRQYGKLAARQMVQNKLDDMAHQLRTAIDRNFWIAVLESLRD
jgi:hypothetical protein